LCDQFPQTGRANHRDKTGEDRGSFLPALGETLPLEIKKELFATLTDEIRAAMKERGLTEDDVLAD
jgi:hypothetical protein